MEYLDSVWQISIIALVAGAMIGALAYRLLGQSGKQADKIKTELNQAREELNSYKTDVNQHFNKTSELVNDLTQNYVKVYQHLSEGAQSLGDSKTFTSLLEQHQGHVSITVDDKTNVTGEVADDLFVDPVVAQETPVDTVDEHAEPFTDDNVGRKESVTSEHDNARAETPSSPGDPGDPGEAREPVLNVDALEEVTANTDSRVEAKADSAVTAGEEKNEVRTTTH